MEFSGYTFGALGGVHSSVGFTFDITQSVTITALGTIDFGGTSIAATGSRPVAIYYANAGTPLSGASDGVHISGDPVPGASAVVTASDPIYALDGGPYMGGDGFRYHTLASPVTISVVGNSHRFEIVSANMGNGFASNWVNASPGAGISEPVYGVYATGTDSAVWGSPAPGSFSPGLAGPNFLTGVPEPGIVGVVGVFVLGMVVRRRN
jgi:hypothetical protein